MAVRIFSEKEMSVLATAMANLVNTKSLCKVKANPYEQDKTVYKILCADGKRRKIRRREILELLRTIAKYSGHEISDDTLSMLKTVGL